MVVRIILDSLALAYTRNREYIVDATESVHGFLEGSYLAIPVCGIEFDGERLVAVRFELLHYLLRALYVLVRDADVHALLL